MEAGNKRAISTSKIRKITAIRKNRREKGRRAEDLGSKPHSNGDAFSRSIILFLASNEASNITIITIIIMKVVKININIIIYSKWFRPSGWKPDILFILNKFNYLINK